MPDDAARPTVTVILPAPLIDLFPGSERQVELAAANVADILDGLDSRWPGMRDRLRDSTPKIRRHINIFVDGERATLATPLAAGAKVFVLTAMSGG
jgi:sulfur-carrier protein